MELVRTASDVNDGLQKQLLKCFQTISALDSPAAQWYGLTQIEPILRPIDLTPCMDEFTIFRNSRVRDMYWELWKVLAPIYHNNGCKSYPYQPLEKYEIRLLSLIKHDGQKLVCRLDTYPHWLAPEYDALSYAWGNPTDTIIIICNELEISIGIALHVALRHLLKGAVRPLRPLWIDAICLNQQDDDEKAHQVPSMGNIYKLATRTVIWLGEAADESDKAMEFLRDLDRKTQIGEDTQEEEAMLISLQTYQNGRRLIESILALLHRSWFSRLWTMQEAALSWNCQVLCGVRILEWSAIRTIVQTLKKLRHTPIQRIPGPMGLIDGWVPIMTTLVVLEGWRLAVRASQINDVHALFVLSESKDCREAVDRIWAISALFPNNLQQRVREAGIIDYSAPSKKQYWKTYLSFLKLLYLESPTVLWEIISYGQGLAKNPNLPSWCPDFNATRQYNHNFYTGAGCRAGFQDAKSSITPTLLLSPESAFLTVKGFTFDTVQSVTQNIFPALTPTEYLDVIEDERKAFRDWLQEIFRLVQETLGISAEAVVRLCRTLVPVAHVPVKGDTSQQEFVLSVAIAYFYEAFRLGDLDDEVPESITSKYDELLNSIIPSKIDRLAFRGRTFITTTQRRIGFGTADMRSGDMVCIVEGADALFVLRRVDHDTVLSTGIHSQEDLDQYPELFRLIGDAYIQNCMYGQAFTASDRGPDREFTLA